MADPKVKCMEVLLGWFTERLVRQVGRALTLDVVSHVTWVGATLSHLFLDEFSYGVGENRRWITKWVSCITLWNLPFPMIR